MEIDEIQIEQLGELSEGLQRCETTLERIEYLNAHPRVSVWMRDRGQFSKTLDGELILKSLVAIGQEKLIENSRIDSLVEDLLPVESFYREIGGIVGYHRMMVSLLTRSTAGSSSESKSSHRTFYRPPGFDISTEDDAVRRYVLEGIISLPFCAEIYPVGGAADRLRYCDPQTQQILPAAKLPFSGRPLLAGLVRDVQAREYLYYKLFGEQLTTPIALMTSHERDNHQLILMICEENRWFGRPKGSFQFFRQPLVPTMDQRGQWCQSENGKLVMKPGGHGVIWKAAKDQGVFETFKKLDRTKVLVRQINNPIAGIDYGLLAFCGIGFAEKKLFGFASCPRQVQSAEGVNVLVESKTENYYEYCLTNIEYCDFQKYGIEDIAVTEGSSYSQYPSNTNILFADILAIEEKVSECPIPGMLVNLKKISFLNAQGHLEEREVVRLESTMQNIADSFIAQSLDRQPIESGAPLNTFLSYQDRLKTISTTKREYLGNGSLLETPEGCFYDLLLNARVLLSEHCGFQLPSLQSEDDYLRNGPQFQFEYLPALGPLYHVIGQKIKGGSLSDFSDLTLEITEVRIEGLHLEGSLKIQADQSIGSLNSQGHWIYCENVGRCQLINVSVINQGIDRTARQSYWSGEITRKEECKIQIEGNGEFFAKEVTFTGSVEIVVRPNTRVTAFMEEGCLLFKEEEIREPSWEWMYHISDEGAIELEYVSEK